MPEEIQTPTASTEAIAEERINALGIMVDIKLRKPSFSAQVNWAELGLNISTDVLKAPRLQAISKARLQQIQYFEGKIRSNLTANSVTVFAGFKYVPFALFEKWYTEHQKLTALYEAEVAKLISESSDAMLEQRQQWETAATTLYNGNTDIQKTYSERDFKSLLVGKMLKCWPMQEELRSKFGIQLTTQQLKTPDMGNIQASANINPEVILAAKRQARRTLENFISEATSSLRQSLLVIIEDINAKLVNGTRLSGRSFGQLAEFISNFQDLNFANDKELEGYIKSIQDFIGNDADRIASNANIDISVRSKLHDTLKKIEEIAVEPNAQQIESSITNLVTMNSNKRTIRR